MKSILQVIQNSSSKQFLVIKPKKSFSRIPHCLFKHITHDSGLSSLEQIIYLHIASNKNNQIAFSAAKLSSLFNCSASCIQEC